MAHGQPGRDLICHHISYGDEELLSRGINRWLEETMAEGRSKELRPCGECHDERGLEDGGHICPGCKSHMHGHHGVPEGEDGYGQNRWCPPCWAEEQKKREAKTKGTPDGKAETMKCAGSGGADVPESLQPIGPATGSLVAAGPTTQLQGPAESRATIQATAGQTSAGLAFIAANLQDRDADGSAASGDQDDHGDQGNRGRLIVLSGAAAATNADVAATAVVEQRAEEDATLVITKEGFLGMASRQHLTAPPSDGYIPVLPVPMAATKPWPYPGNRVPYADITARAEWPSRVHDRQFGHIESGCQQGGLVCGAMVGYGGTKTKGPLCLGDIVTLASGPGSAMPDVARMYRCEEVPEQAPFLVLALRKISPSSNGPQRYAYVITPCQPLLSTCALPDDKPIWVSTGMIYPSPDLTVQVRCQWVADALRCNAVQAMLASPPTIADLQQRVCSKNGVPLGAPTPTEPATQGFCQPRATRSGGGSRMTAQCTKSRGGDGGADEDGGGGKGGGGEASVDSPATKFSKTVALAVETCSQQMKTMVADAKTELGKSVKEAAKKLRADWSKVLKDLTKETDAQFKALANELAQVQRTLANIGCAEAPLANVAIHKPAGKGGASGSNFPPCGTARKSRKGEPASVRLPTRTPAAVPTALPALAPATGFTAALALAPEGAVAPLPAQATAPVPFVPASAPLGAYGFGEPPGENCSHQPTAERPARARESSDSPRRARRRRRSSSPSNSGHGRSPSPSNSGHGRSPSPSSGRHRDRKKKARRASSSSGSPREHRRR
eukprot:jgi/Mesvir1/6564/Mv25656-RA.1